MTNGKAKLLAIAFACGATLGTTFLWMGLTHDSQSEFRLPSGAIDYTYSIEIFLSWFAVGAILGATVFLLTRVAARLLSRRGN